jgi:anthranilate phosphoribosyltransferase
MTEHPFAQYVRTLGKGPNLSRPLTAEETYSAVKMILAGEVEPVQMGAFLCLLRVKTETADEMAGFARAADEEVAVAVPPGSPKVDISWGAYAGKSRQLPWFILSALLLADAGLTVFMHGAEEHTEGRLYASVALAALGVSMSNNITEAADNLRRHRFAAMTLAAMSPRLQVIMDLKPLLGLRSPLHSVGRMIDPFKAEASIMGVAHPNYAPVHQEAGQILGRRRLAVFKGEGGEAERRPEKPCLVHILDHEAMRQEEWPPMAGVKPPAHEESLDPAKLKALWKGEYKNDHAEKTVIATAAIALHLLGQASREDSDQLAADLWSKRKPIPPGAAS